MRVLAIRGRNLASLAGDFEVDFEAEPLADAGIFAITGPTGAGKSTLLDAMCLALFDQVPRLGAAPARSRIETGGGELTASDPRALLRHGAGEGFAEIDFIGRDGERYRARWSVQRAHKRSTGQIQSTKHSLIRLKDQENLSGKKNETLKAIQALVGLSADQFRRAVLLAQGDFEAFIRADDDERALLLERLTGSHIYAALGRAAYEKASVLRQKQQAIRDRIDAQQGLDDEARAAAEATRDAAQAEADSAAATQSALDQAARWEADRAAFADKVTECEAGLARADATREQAAPRREALRHRKNAFAFAGDWRAVGEARENAEAAQRGAITSHAAHDIAMTHVSAAEAEQARATEALEAQTARVAAQAPAIDLARTLDRQIAESGVLLAGIAATRAERGTALKACRTAESSAAQRLADATATRDGHATWLAANPALAVLAAREADLSTNLAEQVEVARRVLALSAEAAKANAEHEAAEAALNASRAGEQDASIAYNGARDVLAAAQAAAPDDDALAMVDRQRDRLAALRPLLVEARHQQAQATTLADTLARLREEQAAAKTGHRDLIATHASLAVALPDLRLRLDEAKRAGTLAEAACGEAAERLRATLLEGEPCPVCGATSHALSALDTVLGIQLEAQRARVAELEDRLSAQVGEEAALQARIEALAGQMLRLAGEIERTTAAETEAGPRSRAAQANLSAGAQAAGLDGADPVLDARLETALATLDAQREAMTVAQAALARARQAEEDARIRRDAAREALDATIEGERDIAQRLATLSERRAHLAETQDRVSRIIDATIGGLADWRLLPDPQRWLAVQAGGWRARSDEHEAAVTALPALDRAASDARTATAAAAARAEEIETQAFGWEAAGARLATERAALLGGETVEAVVSRGETALALARQTEETARAALAQAGQARAAACAHAEASAQASHKADEDHAARDRDFRARLTALSLEEVAVAEAAHGGQAAIEAEEQALALFDRAAADAATLLAQRRDDLARHEAGDHPALLGEALAEALDAARLAGTAAQATLSDAQFTLRRDDEVRAQTATLRADLERERAAGHVWLQLADLIGDREGRTFRRFAQGLTLDRLLAHANGRLADLKPRYALERGQGGDMLIQVIDHDMAGEVRGVHNLSGGERFLISLALALGLAEMSTGRGLRIESLFIDEGFGALDTASLGQAIAVLEHLHASGRRVGVISHVEEVKERIPVKIEVTPVTHGKSVLRVVAG